MDWIRSTKCILNPSKRLLWFEEDIKETFILSSEKNSNDELAVVSEEYNDYSEWDSLDIDGYMSWEWHTNCLIKP